MNNNERIAKIFSMLLLVVGTPVLIFCMWAGVDIDSLECIKGMNACTIYTRKAFQQSHIKEFFKISDIISYRIEKGRASGRYVIPYDYYYPILITKNGEFWLYDFCTHSYDKAELIAKRIMDNQDFKIKGNYYKTLTDGY